MGLSAFHLSPIIPLQVQPASPKDKAEALMHKVLKDANTCRLDRPKLLLYKVMHGLVTSFVVIGF